MNLLKNRNFKLRSQFCRFLMLSLSLLLSYSALALSTDNQQPAHFSSDQFQYNQKTNKTIFTGHVQMSQGSTHLTADQLTVYRDKEGKVSEAVAVSQSDQLAHYTTLPDNSDDILDAVGKTIEYYPQAKQAIIRGQGLVTQGPTHFSGSLITYDMAKQQVISLPTAPGEQTVLVLQPQHLPGSHMNKPTGKTKP